MGNLNLLRFTSRKAETLVAYFLLSIKNFLTRNYQKKSIVDHVNADKECH